MCDDDLSTYNDDTVHNMWVDNSYYMNTGKQPYLNSPKSQQQTPVSGPAANSAAGSGRRTDVR